MKTKLFFSMLLPLIFSSCIKDFHGGGPEKIEFTKENYVYEGELYRLYLKAEIEKLDVTIQALEDKLNNNQGDDQTKVDLAAAQTLRGVLKDDASSIGSLEQVGIRLPSPPPPCPIPRNCDFSGLEYILTSGQTEKLRILLFDEKDNVIGGGTVDELSPLAGSQGQINFSKLVIGAYDSPVTRISVQATNFDKSERIYELK